MNFFMKKFVAFFLLLILMTSSNVNGWCDSNETLTGGRLATVGVVSEVPFEFIGQNILVKAKLNNSNKEYTLILDTGDPTFVLSQKVIDELGDPGVSSEGTSTDAANVSQKVKQIYLRSVQVGGVKVENCRVDVLDKNPFESYGLKADGIIGRSFLKFLTIRIDYAQKIVTLSGKKENSLRPVRGYKIRLREQLRHLTTDIKIGSTKLQSVIIDTGDGGDEYLSLPMQSLEQLKQELNCPLISSIGPGVNGLFEHTQAKYSRVSTVKWGSFKVKNLPVQFWDSPHACISNRFLSQFTVTIDYPKMLMYLLPDKNKPFATNIDSWGINIQKDESGKVRVIGLWEGSPAEKAGLQVGDEITNFKVNGNDCLFEELGSYLGGEGDITFGFQVVNSSGKREVALKKAKLLPEIERINF